jgi:STE24 endopeptidase
LLLERFPESWWLLAAAFVVLISVVMTVLAPIVLLPIFFKLRTLDDPDLTQRLRHLAEKAGTRVRGVFTINLSSKMTIANAALVGLGNTRRIVLGDTLLAHYSPEEIEVILAHELGHHAHGDIAKMLLAQSAITLAGFYVASLVLKRALAPLGFQSIADVAAFPLLMLVLGGLATLVEPLERAYSRYIERAADEYALRTTDNPQAFISGMTKLAHQNLAESDPSRWVEWFFYDHPPYQKRVEHARRYAAICPQTPSTLNASH